MLAAIEADWKIKVPGNFIVLCGLLNRSETFVAWISLKLMYLVYAKQVTSKRGI